MITNHEQVFAARLDSLGAATAFVEACCATHAVAHGDVLRLTLVVEELFTNTVRHGHRGDSDAAVTVALAVSPAQLELRYEDRAPPFDPLHHLATAPPEPEADLAQRQPGGWGLRMVRQMAHHLEHEIVDGGNRLRIVLLRQQV